MFKTPLPEKLVYADDAMSGSGLQETKMRVNQLIDYLKEREEPITPKDIALYELKAKNEETAEEIIDEMMEYVVPNIEVGKEMIIDALNAKDGLAMATTKGAYEAGLKEREEVPRVERCGLGIMKREEVEEKPKRWRGVSNEYYYYVGSGGRVTKQRDYKTYDINFRYAIGNYFETYAEAEAYRERLLEMGKE